MPEVEYTTTLSLSREAVWTFVKDMNNWAPFLTGYQSHQIIDETDSIRTRPPKRPKRWLPASQPLAK